MEIKIKETYIAKTENSVFVCIRKPLLVCKCEQYPPQPDSNAIFAAEYGGMKVSVYPYENYGDLNGEEAMRFEELVLEQYRAFENICESDVFRLETVGRLIDPPEWLCGVNAVNNKICMFNPVKGLAVSVEREADGSHSYGGERLTHEILDDVANAYKGFLLGKAAGKKLCAP